MFRSLKRILRWDLGKSTDPTKKHTSMLMAAFLGIFEDILFWESMWLSLSFILVLNLVFFICVHRQINFLGFICCFCATLVSIDALEVWLKYKHRNNWLKKLASYNQTKLTTVYSQINVWIRTRCTDLFFLREVNHTKAFLLMNIMFSIVFLIGRYVSGYLFMYILCMLICFANKLIPPVKRVISNIHLNAESDTELEGLIPEISDVDMKILSIEPEPKQIKDERQSLDYWKPVDVPIEEASDSSDNSSSLVTNLSVDKMPTFDKGMETSDSSEDEYMPLVQQKEQLQTTMEVLQPADTWGSSAFNALRNISGVVSGMIYTSDADKKRKRIPSIDSSDGFEMIDKNDL